MNIIKYESRLFRFSPKMLSGESTNFDRFRELLRSVRGYVVYALDVEGMIVSTVHIKHNYLHKYLFMEKDDCIINPYWTHKDYRNKGYARMLLKLVINNNNNWNRLYAVVSENNTPSIKCLEAVGMRRIGYAKKWFWCYKITQESQPLVVYCV